MAFESKLECDAAGCCNETNLHTSHSSDVELAIQGKVFPDGKWLDDTDGGYYCPRHASEAAEELELEYCC